MGWWCLSVLIPFCALIIPNCFLFTFKDGRLEAEPEDEYEEELELEYGEEELEDEEVLETILREEGDKEASPPQETQVEFGLDFR